MSGARDGGVLERLAAVQERIERACTVVGRDPSEVALLPVSKTRSAAEIEPVVAAGYRSMGENRVQEVVAKAPDLPQVSWTLIGPLQSNKMTKVVQLVDQFQGLDSLDIAEGLHSRLETAGRELDVMVQVNTSGELTKSGLAPDEVVDFCQRLGEFTTLKPVGLMTIATNTPDQDEVARCFSQLAQLREELRQGRVANTEWPELSMGMSADLETAIAHGSTMVRIGRAIFGERD
ncbi:YggS family pyridoxal phosphate-dependent enzyme [Aestuariimicrobium sp. p3-SID1156]|uniref:YggS family pyridoxal phosphate-dependent enzyme n=1 Tax=Aestuariimicrobium sp. p3-SID1156 TaxID=2916038 RepID=UPI00223ABD6A|nr:YggS family pyridoxal phosphate-dependent enzyme [Aestuariimicrobium sp. p3-SID1156]MCT1459922.1 YggS family pyridoxal phosphate-dependent enzyme [Aestuariimicrobium sp. p3-SID1156]